METKAQKAARSIIEEKTKGFEENCTWKSGTYPGSYEYDLNRMYKLIKEIETLVKENDLGKKTIDEAKEKLYVVLMTHGRYDDALAFAKKYGL